MTINQTNALIFHLLTTPFLLAPIYMAYSDWKRARDRIRFREEHGLD